MASPARPRPPSRARRSRPLPDAVATGARAAGAVRRRRRRGPRVAVPRRRSRRRRRRARSKPCDAGATPSSSVARSRTPPRCASTRFHIQNDHGDWNTIHHSFTSANALHHALERRPTPELLRGCVHAALRVYLDRFLNVPAARLPSAKNGDLDTLAQCFEIQGGVDDAGNEAYGFLVAGGPRAELIAHARSRAARRGRRASTGSRRSRPASVRPRGGPRGPRSRR